MALLPIIQTTDRVINQLQNSIAQVLRPIVQNPLVNGSILTGVELAIGANTINHGLNRTLQGWFVIGQGSAASLYDSQSSNTQASKTLILVSDAAVTVNLYVF